MKTLIASFAAALSLAAAARTAAPLTVVDGNNMPLVEVSLDGQKAVLILDTGASHTTFDLAFVTNSLPHAKLQDVRLVGATNVKTPPKFVEAGKLGIGGEEFDIPGVMALDLGHLSASVGRHVDGVLGMDHLRRKPCIISLRRGLLILDPDAKDLEGFREILPRARGNCWEMVVKLPGKRFQPMLLDTGSSYTFINRELWPAAEGSKDVSIGAAAVNGREESVNTPGKPGEFDCGPDLAIPARPILTAQKDLNQIGSDTFRNVDILLSGDSVRLRPAPAK